MTTKDEVWSTVEALSTERALKLALEALEDALTFAGAWPNGVRAITAIRVALASKSEALASGANEQQQEPDYNICPTCGGMASDPIVPPEYRQQSAERVEPVAWVCEASSSDEKHAIDYWPGDVDDLPIGTKLYTAPPIEATPLASKRSVKPWQGLTDEEKERIRNTWGLWTYKAIEDTEAKLKEKNEF